MNRFSQKMNKFCDIDENQYNNSELHCYNDSKHYDQCYKKNKCDKGNKGEKGDKCDKCDKGDKVKCSKKIPIRSVPIIISLPGKYCVLNNLVYSGTGPAITIRANNVSIDFNNHDLTLTNGSAIGIFAENVQEIEIRNDKIIQNVSPTSRVNYGIQLFNVKKVFVDNVYITGPREAITIKDSEFIRIENSLFENNEAPCIALISTGDVLIRYCTLSRGEHFGYFGIVVLSNFPNPGICRNITIEHVTFNNLGSAIALTGVNDVMISNVMVNFDRTSPNFAFDAFIAAIELADQDVTPVNNITIRDSTFYAQNVRTGTCGIWLGNGTNSLLENLTIHINSQPENANDVEGAILIGDADPSSLLAFNNVKVSNVVISGGSHDAVAVQRGKNITLDGLVISESDFAGVHIYPNSSTITVKNSDIKNNANGVIIDSGSVSNTVINNVITNNTVHGVLINGNNNQVVNNVIANNAINIQNNGSGNTISPNFS